MRSFVYKFVEINARTVLTRNNYFILLVLFLWGGAGCAKKSIYEVYINDSSIAIDSNIAADEEMLEIIAPYKVQLDETMDEVIGYSELELVKQKGESSLGNFVADVMLKKSIETYGEEIDLAAITIGGLRNPVPEGAIKLRTVYELMPFENSVYILKLTGKQTKLLFDYLAEKQIIAIANSMVILKDGELVQTFIGGRPLDESKTYTLAISDYLAGGGDHMAFLKDAEIVEMLPLMVRDLLIEEIIEQHAAGKKIKAAIEGRVKVI